jgi:hypothetical protein
MLPCQKIQIWPEDVEVLAKLWGTKSKLELTLDFIKLEQVVALNLLSKPVLVLAANG